MTHERYSYDVTTTPRPSISPAPTICVDTDNGASYYDFQTATTYDCSYFDTVPNDCPAGAAVTYDDSDFTANDMCCACGGGSSTRFPTPAPTPRPSISPAPTLCVSTDNGATSVTYETCANYDNYPNNCVMTTLDDDDFTASTMCCVCGGAPRRRDPTALAVTDSRADELQSPFPRRRQARRHLRRRRAR